MEIWKDIPGYEGYYQVSSIGRVKSLGKTSVNSLGVLRTYEPKMLNNVIGSDGYFMATLIVNKKRKQFKVHQLVAMAFLNHTPCGYNVVVDHINNDPLDNRVENLQLITQRLNASKDRGGSSKYTGVNYDKKTKRWRSQIRLNGGKKHLGLFKCELAAAYAYNKALKDLHN